MAKQDSLIWHLKFEVKLFLTKRDKIDFTGVEFLVPCQ